MEEVSDEHLVFPTGEGVFFGPPQEVSDEHPVFFGPPVLIMPSASPSPPPPPPPPPPQRKFGFGQALLAVGGAALLFILGMAQRDMHEFTKKAQKDIEDLSTTAKKAQVDLHEFTEKSVTISEQFLSKGVEFDYNVFTGKGKALVRGGYEKTNNIYKF